MNSVDGVAIREAAASDARAIAEVHVASWRWAYRDDLSDEFLDALSVDDRERTWHERLASDEQAAGTLVAEERRHVIGFCSFGRCRDDDATERTGEVMAIYLLEDVTGRGIGRALFASATDRLRALGYDRAQLWVMATNARSRRFYETAGWSWDGITSEHRFDCANLPIVRYAADLSPGAKPYRVRDRIEEGGGPRGA